jgi:hypothetical protein
LRRSSISLRVPTNLAMTLSRCTLKATTQPLS